MFLWCVLVLLNLVSVATGTNAGVKVRLTQKGLEYGKQNNISCNPLELKINKENKICNLSDVMEQKRVTIWFKNSG